MRIRVLFFTLALTLSVSSQARAGGFTVKRVIPVGPIYGGDMVWPARWSPDGLSLAYFSDSALMVSDTLGVSRMVTSFSHLPRKMEWAGPITIVVKSLSLDANKVRHDRLTQIEVSTGNQLILFESEKQLGSHSKEGVFRGLFRTHEGKAYYEVQRGEKVETKLIGPTVRSGATEATVASPQHIVRPGTDAVYLISMNGDDSIRISNKRYEGLGGLPMTLSPSRQYLYSYGTLIRLRDDSVMVLGHLAGELPKGTVSCGLAWGSFNPVLPEIVGVMTCSDGEDYNVNRMALIDYETLSTTFLDPLVGISQCYCPEFSPDSRRLSFIAHGTLYIVERGQ